jgi:hypothetical protein
MKSGTKKKKMKKIQFVEVNDGVFYASEISWCDDY